ncbi:MAG: DEAD/DEAH box helicase family protein [Desulfobacteraceae bacterium]|jgi:hypothetical protein|nr:DEAD/DEAH box helicase family protein [Desulfobacteraceae bacterium]
MQLGKQLILFRYILKQFGYEDFDTLRQEFNTRSTGSNATGRSYFAGVLVNRTNKRVGNHTLFTYDEAISGYEEKLRKHMAEPFFSLKYYQWFALLFTEYFLDQYVNHQSTFFCGLNSFKAQNDDFKNIDDYAENDLTKLAFWMATGSGKTLLMHCNYWQITRYFKNFENIILITPNEGLSRQHYDDLIKSGIDAKQYSGSEESLKTRDGQVLIIEITKLVKKKEGEGVSVDVDFFSESRNLVFIDEGHKGQKSEEKAWKGLREHITRGSGSFTFEYSATLGQVISITGKDLPLLNEYARSIIFDYSYRHFYIDGYGKDFSVFNIDVADDYSEAQNRLLLTASLLGFYEQLILFEKFKDELRSYNIEKPLWIFVGSKVIGNGSKSLTQADKQNISDVTRIVKYFKFALSQPGELQNDIDKIISANSGLNDENGVDIFKYRYQYLHANKPEAEEILRTVFHGIGSIEAFQIKQADGEIALKTKTNDQYFAVINIGDVPKYIKKLEQDTDEELIVQDDNFTRSLFERFSAPGYPINILIGSKKFIEGWNSWRVSSMGLMNMGKSEGAQIIQLFGRGVRLKGKDLSLKREDANAPYQIRALQTISIFGLNASYMNRFLSEIEKEIPEYTDYSIDLKFNRKEQWNGRLMTFKTRSGHHFKAHIVELAYEGEIAKRITLDLRNRVSVAAGGFNGQVAEDSGSYNVNFIKPYIDFIDFNALGLEADRFRLLKVYTNLIINKDAIKEFLQTGAYDLFSQPGQFGLKEAINGKIQDIACILAKDYINKFYANQEKAFLTKYLTYEMLVQEEHQEMFPDAQRLIVKVPKQHLPVIEELKANIEELYKTDSKILPSIHFGKHLYSPIASWEQGKQFNEIKTIPTRLNKGERDFVLHLRAYLEEASDQFENKDVFILRNLSQRGIGFFIKSSSFFPDFILWIVEKKKQYIYFLDPKGIRETRNFTNSKVIFCREQVVDLEKKINDDLMADGRDLTVSISAYILSVTKFTEIVPIWGEKGASKEAFTENKILFIDDDKVYLNQLFKNLS